MNRKITTHRHLAVMLILSAVVSACGGDKVVRTVDDSADYKSARALPPLNKKLERTPQGAVAAQAPEAVNDNEADQAPAPAVDQTPAADPAPAADQAYARNFVTSELINVNDSTTRLAVELPADEALDYLADKLVASGLTVHHRNPQAGRISIGCGDIQSAPSTKKKSRWTLSGRRTIGKLDYCVLELNTNRLITEVRILDLNQQEVEKSAAEKIFQRILVN